jgi:menaquinone-9 beta-reductase
MEEREVIVVGAGPTGSAVATALAREGRDVLLLDRQDFPRDKSCGDGIPASAISKLYDLGLREKVLNANFYPVHKLSLYSPKGYHLSTDLNKDTVDTDSYIIPRLHLDAMIQEHAVSCGAQFLRAQVMQPLLENGRVIGVQAKVDGLIQEIRSKLLIAADGVTSVIVRTLRGKKHEDHHRAVAVRAYVEDIEELPHEVEFFLYRDILPGYAWIFPLGEGKANIGLGMRLDQFRQKKQSLEQMLQVFLDMPVIKKRLKQGGILRDVLSWQLNFGSQENLQHTFDGAILAGDAAGFINPLTGGGIHNGLLSARIAADVATQALRQNDTSRAALRLYEERCHQEMWKDMRRSYLIQRLVLNFPFIGDWLIRWAGRDSSLAQAFISKL